MSTASKPVKHKPERQLRRRKHEGDHDYHQRVMREQPPERKKGRFKLNGEWQEFVWGAILAVHRVGEYTIIEYEPSRAGNVHPEAHDWSPDFHPYIGDRDTGHSYGSLDRALVGAIALKHDGQNTRADGYFMRGIGAEQ